MNYKFRMIQKFMEFTRMQEQCFTMKTLTDVTHEIKKFKPLHTDLQKEPTDKNYVKSLNLEDRQADEAKKQQLRQKSLNPWTKADS